MWWKKKASILADDSDEPRGYGVYMVVIGDYDAYDVIGVYEDRHAARYTAGKYNVDYGARGNITRWARVEEISFYPAQAPASGDSA